eukprot:gene27403-34112_t
MVTREPPEQCLFCSGGTSVEEHLLVSIVTNILPFSRSIEKESFRDAHTAGGLRLMSQAVQFRSVKRYSADWNRWLAFMRQWMDSLEPREDDVFLLDVPLRAQVATLAAFMHFQFVDLHLRASTIISGMSGVRHQFRSNLLPVEIFSNQSLSACKNALTLEERKLEGLSAVQRRHPLTGDMLTWIGGQCVATGLVVDNMFSSSVVEQPAMGGQFYLEFLDHMLRISYVQLPPLYAGRGMRVRVRTSCELRTANMALTSFATLKVSFYSGDPTGSISQQQQIRSCRVGDIDFALPSWRIDMDVMNGDTEFTIPRELPGISKDKVNVRLENNMLTVKSVNERCNDKLPDSLKLRLNEIGFCTDVRNLCLALNERIRSLGSPYDYSRYVFALSGAL